VVANLPYYLSSPLLFKLLAVRDRLSRMVLMLQAEVADRLIAAPRTRDYGILSVVAAYYAELRIGFRVSRNCFRPRPEVGSAVVTLRPRSEAPIHVMDEAAFIKTVRAAFAHRRKTIANSLRDEGFDPDLIVDALGEVHLDPSRRAETLSLADFAGLANVLTGRNAFAV
jgi:16S rRNA (adenine1518-N6/adenine1519-N6)-dimethyltransferase